MSKKIFKEIMQLIQGILSYKIKAQFNLEVLLMSFITLVVFSHLYPTMKEMIDDLVPQTDPLTAILVQLLPFLIISAIIGTIWKYTLPKRT